MNTLKLLPTMFVMSCTILTSCSPKITEKLSWQSIPVTIDGQANEYGQTGAYINQTKMVYALTNDRTNLYICLKTNDEPMQRKIMRSGMELWIDTTSRVKKQTGIVFPLANEHKLNMAELNPGAEGERPRPDVAKMKQNFLLGQSFMQLQGFKHTSNGLSHLENNSGIKVKINWDSSNTMIYEAAIPFRTFYKETLSARDSTKIFILTINVNAIQGPHLQPGEGHGGEGRGGGGGGHGGGHGGGGHGGGEMSGGQHSGGNAMGDKMSEKNTFSKRFRLNVKAY